MMTIFGHEILAGSSSPAAGPTFLTKKIDKGGILCYNRFYRNHLRHYRGIAGPAPISWSSRHFRFPAAVLVFSMETEVNITENPSIY